jgi:hypothetical protein
MCPDITKWDQETKAAAITRGEKLAFPHNVTEWEIRGLAKEEY